MSKKEADRELSWEEIEPLLDELKRIARYALAKERNRDLQTTELMQTALRRMFQTDDGWDYDRVWENRGKVFAYFHTVVLHTLLSRGRARTTLMRTAPGRVVSFDDLVDPPVGAARDPELLHDLGKYLDLLAQTAPRAAEILVFSQIVGLDSGEIAAILGISERHCRREIAAALQMLKKLLEADS